MRHAKDIMKNNSVFDAAEMCNFSNHKLASGSHSYCLLKFCSAVQPEGVFTKEIDREVARTKCNEKWRREYMKEVLQYFDIKEEGRQKGKQEINRLIQLLADQNRMEDIVRSAQDEEYQKRLLEEFHICERENA